MLHLLTPQDINARFESPQNAMPKSDMPYRHAPPLCHREIETRCDAMT